ncbi:unnamed protein product [Dibothriocephalus latus]|uniref:Uncharacterized protein n=1 Tax=Dibothriocephalus latus TaxID=60516 RepID=A0A3P7RCZ6_DIBLA|nr:unnamed protein product [Dibothriocephalus latus]
MGTPGLPGARTGRRLDHLGRRLCPHVHSCAVGEKPEAGLFILFASFLSFFNLVASSVSSFVQFYLESWYNRASLTR